MAIDNRERHVFRIAAGIAVLVLLLSGIAVAQITGTIAGTVTNASSGLPIVGASIFLDAETTPRTTTGLGGSFTIADVVAGTHTVKAVAIGFNTATVTVTVQAGLTATANIAMAPATSISVGTVTRSFSATTVALNAIVVVTLTPSANLPNNPAWRVDEIIPAGWTFVSTTAALGSSSQPNNVRRFIHAGGTAFTYTVRSPAQTGSFTFSGTFMDADQNTGTVGGATTVTVSTVTPPPATAVGDVTRILDEKVLGRSIGPFTWDAQNFQGFWYDLDKGESSETLELRQTGLGRRFGFTTTIEDQDFFGGQGGLVYRTARRPVLFEVVKNTNLTVDNALDASLNKVIAGTHYAKLGFMGEEFTALNGNARKLSKLLIEQKASETKTLAVGESWQIENWTLTVNAVDMTSLPRRALLILSYSGQVLDISVVSEGEVYTYLESTIAGESNAPMFATFVDSIFPGATTSIVQLRYTWAISRNVTEIRAGDIIGVFEMDATTNELVGKLDTSIDLSPGSTTTLARNLIIKVAADNEFLRFMPDKLITEPAYELRGFVLDEKITQAPLGNFTWDAQSFRGFWYDLDEGISSETLELRQTNLGAFSGRTRIIRNKDDPLGAGLIYNTTRQLKLFELSENTNKTVQNSLDATGNKVLQGTYYAKLGWLGEEFVALNGNSGKLTRLLIEQKAAASEKKTLAVGESWQIGNWTLTASSVNNTLPRQAKFILSYRGQVLDDKVVNEGEVYTYVEPLIAGENNVPMFAALVDTVFVNIVQLRFTWAISREVTEVRAGDVVGVFEVADAGVDKVTLANNFSIDLSPNSTIILAGNLAFKVADDADFLRFYPKVDAGASPGQLAAIIVSPSPAFMSSGQTQQFTATGRDVNGNIIYLNLTWSSSNITVGTISPSGLFIASGAGTTIITASSDSVSGSATVIVNVAGALPPEVVPFDLNSNGIIERSEAVDAVVRFFGGDPAVPRATAVAVVVAFFSV